MEAVKGLKIAGLVVILLLVAAWFARPEPLKSKILRAGFDFSKIKFDGTREPIYSLPDPKVAPFDVFLKGEGFASTEETGIDLHVTHYSRGLHLFGWTLFGQKISVDHATSIYTFEPDLEL